MYVILYTIDIIMLPIVAFRLAYAFLNCTEPPIRPLATLGLPQVHVHVYNMNSRVTTCINYMSFETPQLSYMYIMI